jgi:hypothetical protein
VKLTLGTAARPEVRRATARPGAADGGIGSTSENWGGQQRHLERATGGGGEPPTGDADRRRDFGRCDTVWPKKGLWPVTGAAAGQGAAHSTSNQEDTGDGDAAFLETDRRQVSFLRTVMCKVLSVERHGRCRGLLASVSRPVEGFKCKCYVHCWMAIPWLKRLACTSQPLAPQSVGAQFTRTEKNKPD